MDVSIQSSLQESNRLDIFVDGEWVGRSFTYPKKVKIDGIVFDVLGTGRTKIVDGWRGRGVGKRFFELLREKAISIGYAYVVGFCDDEQMAEMYRHLGWKVFGEKVGGKFVIALGATSSTDGVEKIEVDEMW